LRTLLADNASRVFAFIPVQIAHPSPIPFYSFSELFRQISAACRSVQIKEAQFSNQQSPNLSQSTRHETMTHL
jgi:hypothetical protein